MDIGSDAFLAYEYKQDAIFYTKFSNSTSLIRVKWENDSLWQSDQDTCLWTRDQRWSSITEACADQYLCTESPKTSIQPTASCAVKIRKVVGVDSPKHQLETAEESLKYMWSTLSFMFAGGMAQTVVAIILACGGNDTFVSLPLFVRVLVLISSPFLLGPVVVTVYLIVRCVKGITEVDLERYKVLIGILKMGEILLETVPQLIINALSLVHKCTCNRSGEDSMYSGISNVKWLSITTSILGLAYAKADWIKKTNSDLFISRKHHPMSSIVASFVSGLLCNLTLFTGIVNVCVAEGMLRDLDDLYWPDSGPFWHRFHPLPGVPGGTVTIGLYPILTLTLFLLIICSPCMKARCCKHFKLCVSIVYIFVLAGQNALLTHIHLLSGYKPMVATLVFAYCNLLTSVLFLPFPAVGAAIVDPMVRLICILIHKIGCKEMKEKLTSFKNSEEDTIVHLTRSEDKEQIEIMITFRYDAKELVPRKNLSIQ